jgi:hypothetical protein
MIKIVIGGILSELSLSWQFIHEQKGVFMSRILILLTLMLSFALVGCSKIDGYVSKVEQKIKKKDECISQTTRIAPSYTTDISYRCVGEGCHDYGCNKP